MTGMTHPLADIAWPLARLGEAIEALGRAAELAPVLPTMEIPKPPASVKESGELQRWVEAMAATLRVEAESVEISYADVATFVMGAGPAILEIQRDDERLFLAILRGGKRTLTVVDCARVLQSVSAEVVVKTLRRPLEDFVAADIDAMLERTVAPRRRPGARGAILRERLGAVRLTGSWLLRSSPSSSLVHLARRAHLPRLLAWMIGAHAVEYVLVLLSWWAVAKGALQGRYDTGWLVAWLLLLVTLVPFRFLSAWAASRLSIGAGTLLKTRLLVGALRLDPNEIRHQGSGQLLSRVIESSAVETLGLASGLASVVALLEIVACLFVLGQGVGGLLHVLLMVVVVLATAFASWHYLDRRRHWTEVRLSMTHDLVERMVGHRTRLAQEPRTRWHEGEDQTLERYLVASRRLDRATIALSLIPRIWLFVGIGALAPGLMMGTPSTTGLALALGGVLLGYLALQSLTGGVSQLAGAVIGWSEAGPLIRAAARAETAPAPIVASATSTTHAPGSMLLRAQDVRFRYRSRGEPVLQGCSLSIHVGDRLLLEGPSGGGKSTLGSVLTGLRPPESGLLLLGGLDRQVLGAEGWRRRVVAAPQFHENHVFGATFAFNLLMGRGWPPGPRDIEEAEAICRELGLGPLLDRMPAGLQQMVGETGWQLSHGEKSRLYIARALLQNADLIVLDESFAALDPETLKRSLQCVLDRARSLLVIAHP
jgi:ATP-binding cassette, subfamily B, bacterial